MIVKFILWIICLNVQSSCLENLALNKKAYLSSVFLGCEAKYAVDGNKDRYSFAHAESHDGDNAGWFVVDLGRPYQVEYIVFYHRQYCPDCDDRMDNFIVGLSNNFDPQINKTIIRYNYKLCGQYNGALVPGSVVDLQCQDKEAYSRYVIIQQDFGKTYLTIPELEVFGESINYVGCFDALLNNKSFGSKNNLEDCMALCQTVNYIFLTFQKNKCICGNQTRYHSPLSECNGLCPGGFDNCESSVKLSVYEVHSEQHGLIFLRNSHCKNGIGLDSDGICINKKCEDGWIGHGCTVRHCSVNNGDCGIHTCMNTTLNRGYVCECICKEGYDKRFWWDYCQDINECKDEIPKCNTSTSTCINHQGYFECLCFSGFRKFGSATQCEDIDECKNTVCNKTTMNCRNTFGSYICECKEGFIQEGPKNCRDINECEDMPHVCNLKISNCTNTFGSYECRWFDKGYHYEVLVYVMLSIFCTVGTFICIKYRKKLIANITRKRKLSGSPNSLKENAIGVLTLTELKDYYLTNKERLLNAFEKFPQVSGSPSTYGQNINLKEKNNNINIIPFDCNRVVLKTLSNYELSDYINASFIPSFQGPFLFIATQSPMKETQYDFWRMILEYKVEIIVMLTNCVEEGKVMCLQYWPNTNSINIGDIDVILKDLKCRSTYDIRRFAVTKDNVTHDVTHLSYKLWLKNETLRNIGSLLNMHHIMNTFKKQNSFSPVVIHCDDGVGRTGAFLAMDYLLHEAQQTGMVDVFKCLKLLRAHRNYMIRTKIQFVAVFDMLCFYHDWGNTTTIRLSEVNIYHLVLKRKCFIEKEYMWISQNALPCNKDQNFEKETTKLIFQGCVQNSTYKIYVKTEISWPSVIECCRDANKSITILIDDKLVEQGFADLPLVGEDGNLHLSKRFSHLLVKHIEMVTTACDRHLYSNEKIDIFAISSHSLENLRHLWSAVKEVQPQDKTLQIYSHDLNKAGFVVCALNLLEMMDDFGEIDIFQAVYQLKTLIPHFMDNFEQYRNLNLLVENYLTSNQE